MRNEILILLCIAGCSSATPLHTKECDDHGDCPVGQHCSTEGACVPEAECEDDVDCPPDHHCSTEGTCEPDAECEDDVDCPPEHHCSTEGACVPEAECEDDVDCPPDHHCNDGVCESDTTPACANAGTGTQTWNLTALRFPGPGEVIGFDLDNHYTTSGDDPIGCGQVDLAGGVDNMLAGLLGLVSLVDASLDVNVLIEEAIADGSIRLTAILSGYDGVGDDEALISLLINDEPVDVLQGICMKVNAAGDLVGDFPSLPLALPTIPIDESTSVDLTLDVTDVRIVITNPSGNNVASAVIGGGVLWIDGEGNGLEATIVELVTALAPEFADLVSEFALTFLDLGEPGACDTISLGVDAEFTRVE
jgi:hypothetical protein